MAPKNSSQQSSPSNWLEGVLSNEGAITGMMKNSQTAFEDGVRTMSDETLQFINKRLEHNSRTIEQYRECKDASDFVNVQQKWLVNLAHDYNDEALRMSEVARKMFISTLPANGHAPASPKGEKHQQV